MDTMKEEMEQLERELAVWKHEVGLLREQLANADNALNDIILTFIDLRDQRDRLAEALKSVASGAVEEANCIKIAREALASLKGGKDE